MHILNIVTNDERPETIRKPIIIPELELDDLKALVEAPTIKSRDFSAEIALAAADGAISEQKAQSSAKVQAAQTLAKDLFKTAADSVKEQTGMSIGYLEPWAYEPKPKAAYKLWKTVVTMYIDQPDTLDIGSTAMALKLNQRDNGYVVTRDMFYDKLNRYAKKDLERLLKLLGVTLQLRGPVTIRSVRKALIERRETSAGVPIEEFAGRFVIRGNAITLNGVEYKIQLGKSGKRRIRHRGEWLPLDVLKSICLGT